MYVYVPPNRAVLHDIGRSSFVVRGWVGIHIYTKGNYPSRSISGLCSRVDVHTPAVTRVDYTDPVCVSSISYVFFFYVAMASYLNGRPFFVLFYSKVLGKQIPNNTLILTAVTL